MTSYAMAVEIFCLGVRHALFGLRPQGVFRVMDTRSKQKLRVSVLMPTFNQAHFIGRAIASLLGQTLKEWELIIMDDGSPDDTFNVVNPFLADVRIHYHRMANNQGLGVVLNQALTLAEAPLIAYLPSDDVYYSDHLALLIACLDLNPDSILAFSGVRHEIVGVMIQDPLKEHKEEIPLQLVQVIHRKTPDRWLERSELVTDDLDIMYWSKLRTHGSFVATNRISSEWVNHPLQRHKIIQEPSGGINPYRVYYNVKHPLRFESTVGNPTDEIEQYRRFRDRSDTSFAPDGLKILLVGELAYNPERVLALEERGHKLYGLWTRDVSWFNTVGPLPFGHIEDLPYEGWREAIEKVKPDIIYALLNDSAVPFAHHILKNNPGVPFVWHLKESPFSCIARGTWPQLIDLYSYSDGHIYCNPETRDWFNTICPRIVDNDCSFILDGDLPKRDWFTTDRSPRFSESDGQIHTVVVGHPQGLSKTVIAQLAQHKIHIHLCGGFIYKHKYWKKWLEEAQNCAPDHFHIRPYVPQEQWVTELSKYDAGWLHITKRENLGDLHRINWDDLNYPARIPTLTVAGVPMIQYDHQGSIVATQSLLRQHNMGVFYRDIDQLVTQMRDTESLALVRESIWQQREQFTFDYHADRLIAFFRHIIARKARA